MKTQITLATLSLAIIMSCSSKQTEQVNNTEKDTQAATIETATPVVFEDSEVTQVVFAYTTLKDYLVETNYTNSTAAARKLVEAIAATSNEELKALLPQVQELADAENIESQRALFINVSDELFEQVKSKKLVQGTLYQQHCPMANDNQGANWLSFSPEIRNPYFGDKMLKCGSVVEQIES